MFLYMNDIDLLLARLERSRFRSSFHLNQKYINYCHEKGYQVIRQHACDFVAKRLAPAYIPNDGKQTPMKNHPVFIAQHATATCCRQCLYKWHHIPVDRQLSTKEQEYIVNVIMKWIEKEIK